MMRQIRLLIKVSLQGMFGLNEFLHTKDRRKKVRYCLMGLLWGFLFLLLAGYVCAMSLGLVAMGAGRLVPAVLAVSVSAIVFFFTVFKAGAVLFDWRTYEKQIAMPVTVRAVIVSRFFTMYITDLLMGFLVMLPGMAVYGVLEKPKATFYFYGIIAVIFLPLLPLAAASLLGALITGISSRWKHKNLITAVLTLALACAVLVGNMRFSGMVGGMEESELNVMFRQLSEEMEGQIQRIYPPAVWITDAMVQGSVWKLMLFLVVSMGSFLLFLEILKRFYVNICMLLSVQETKGNYRMKELREKSVLGTMVERELRHYFSSPVYVTNTLMGEVLMVLLAAAVLLMDTEVLETMLGLPGVIQRALPILMGFLPVMMPLTSCSISIEGKQWWMMQTLPVTRKNIIRSKMTAQLIVAFPFYLVSEVLLFAGMLFFHTLRPGWADAISLLAMPAVYILFGARAGLAVNERFPLFEWENEVRVVKQSASVVVTMLVGMAVALVPVVILVVLPEISAYWMYLVMGCLLLAAVGIMDFYHL